MPGRVHGRQHRSQTRRPGLGPLWQAHEDSGIIILFLAHHGLRPDRNDRVADKAASVFENTKLFLENFVEPFVDLFAWDPRTAPRPTPGAGRGRRGLASLARAGTRPPPLEDVGAKEFWADKGGAELVTKPSDLFKRQVWATFQDDEVAMALIPFFGEDHLLWASDYPHPRQRLALLATGDRPPDAAPFAELRRKLTHDNAAALLKLERE